MHIIVAAEGDEYHHKNFKEWLDGLEYLHKGKKGITRKFAKLRELRLYEIIVYKDGKEKIYSELLKEQCPAWQMMIDKMLKWFRKIVPFIDRPPQIEGIEPNKKTKFKKPLPKIILIGEKDDIGPPDKEGERL